MTQTPAPDPSSRTAARPQGSDRLLLQSIVDVARAIFGSAASSIFLLDARPHELVFEAVSGEGEEFLVGRRFPADRGIAGWVVTSGEAMVVHDLAASRTFARDLAESTEYVPQSLMAAPLTWEEGVLGVLEVLDPAPQARSSLGELDLLSLFARQAAAALSVVTQYRAAQEEARLRQAAALRAPGTDREGDARLLDAFRDFLQGA